MAKQTTPQMSDLMQPMQMMTQFALPAAAMAPQAEVIWQTQKSLMQEWDRYAHAWFERRRDAAESAQRCAEHMRKANGDGAPEETVAEINGWLSEEMKRLSTDAVENMEFCMRCFGLMSQGATSAGERLSESVAEAGEESAKAPAKRGGTKSTAV